MSRAIASRRIEALDELAPSVEIITEDVDYAQKIGAEMEIFRNKKSMVISGSPIGWGT